MIIFEDIYAILQMKNNPITEENIANEQINNRENYNREGMVLNINRCNNHIHFENDADDRSNERI